MQFVKSSVERIDCDDRLKKIELCGRLAYKSEDKITEKSAIKFVSNLINSRHLSVLEHASIIISTDLYTYTLLKSIKNEYLEFTTIKGRNIVSSNVRGWIGIVTDDVEKRAWIAEMLCNADESCNVFFSHIDYKKSKFTPNCTIISETDLNEGLEWYIHSRPSFRIITNRAISHMLVRHRKLSFIQESQRYCNYSKEKFGGSVQFCIPIWAKSIKEGSPANGIKYTDREEILIRSLQKSETDYLELLSLGLKAEEARDVLPNATKTEIIITGNIRWWDHFFNLRLPNSAHPEVRQLAKKIKSMI